MDDIMGEVERSKSEINELINQLSREGYAETGHVHALRAKIDSILAVATARMTTHIIRIISDSAKQLKGLGAGLNQLNQSLEDGIRSNEVLATANSKYSRRMTWLTVALVGATVVLAAVGWRQMVLLDTYTLETQIASSLTHRPYVSISFNDPQLRKVRNSAFYGKDIIFRNTGKAPASNISTQYYITTDLDEKDMSGLKWFEENLGGYGSISFIAPEAEEREPGSRDLSPNAEYYYFEAITTYGGES